MEQKFNNDEIEIDLMEIFMVLMRWAWVIAGVAIIGMLGGFCISKFLITPTYESTSRIVVLNQDTNSDTLTMTDLQMGTQLINDYPELITSRYVVESVINTFELDTTYEEFVNKIEVTTGTNTRIIDITLTDTDPLMAKEMVDELREVAAVRIKEIMQIEAVNVVDEGNIPTTPAAPSVMKWTIIGLLLGGFLAAAVVIVIYLLDDTIKSSEDVEKYLGLSTLGLIPIMETEEERKKKHTRHRSKQEEQKRAEEREARESTKKMVVVDLNEEQ